MSESYVNLYGQVKSKLFKKSIFKDYYKLYDKGAYREAYVILRDIVNKYPEWSKKGDPYVTFAKLELYSNDNIDAAMKLLSEAKKLGCSDMAAYYCVLGKVLLKKGESEDGIQSLEKSVELNPSINNLKIFGSYLTLNGDKRSIDIWKRILKKDSRNCVAYLYLGIESDRAGDNDEALLMNRKAEYLARTKEDFYEMACAYYKFSKYKNALSFFLKCEKLDYKTYTKLYAEIAFCYQNLGEYNKVVLYASKALHVDPNHEYAKELLLQFMKEDKENEPILLELAEKYPDTCLSYILRTHTSLINKDYLNVQNLLSKAMQLRPSAVEMHYCGRLYFYLNLFDKAINTYFISEKLGYPYLSNLFYDIAYCYFSLQNINSAIEYSVKSLDSDFNNESAKELILWCANEQESSSALDRLILKHPERCLSYILLAKKYLEKKNYLKARELIIKAEKLNPSEVEMSNILGILGILGTPY